MNRERVSGVRRIFKAGNIDPDLFREVTKMIIDAAKTSENFQNKQGGQS